MYIINLDYNMIMLHYKSWGLHFKQTVEKNSKWALQERLDILACFGTSISFQLWILHIEKQTLSWVSVLKILCETVKVKQGKCWAVKVLFHVSIRRVWAHKNSLKNRFSVTLYFYTYFTSFSKMGIVPKEWSRWQVLYLKGISKKYLC